MSQRLNYTHISPSSSQALYKLSQRDIPDERIRHLVVLRASQLNGCAFCVDMHVKEALIAGESELRLHHVVIWRESPLFNEQERAALELTEILTRHLHEGLDDETYARLSKPFTEQEFVELVYTISVINVWNRLGVVFQTTPGSLDKQLHLDRAGLA